MAAFTEGPHRPAPTCLDADRRRPPELDHLDAPLRDLLERLREHCTADPDAPPVAGGGSAADGPCFERHVPAGRGLADPSRACVETNLARRGLWRLAGRRATADRIVERVLDGADRSGVVVRIDAGPSLGVLELQVMVWLCSRWRELRAPDSRLVPLTLEGLTREFGWGNGGHNRAEIAGAMDALRMASFHARIYDARRQETRITTFGLLDRWEAGVRHKAGAPARAGFAELGGWLHQQLRAGYVTYLDWGELRALRRPTAKRLLVFLEAERFPRPAGRWTRKVSPELLDMPGIDARRADHARDTLRAAAAEILEHSPRYRLLGLERRPEGGWALVAERRRRE